MKQIFMFSISGSELWIDESSKPIRLVDCSNANFSIINHKFIIDYFGGDLKSFNIPTSIKEREKVAKLKYTPESYYKIFKSKIDALIKKHGKKEEIF